MRACHSSRLGLGLFVVAAFAAGAAVAGTPVKLEDVPKPAVKAVQERCPKATISSVDLETNGNYEFTMREGDRQSDVGVKPDGKLLNIKEEIAVDKLPKTVTEGLQKKHAGAKIVEAEKVIVIDGKNEKATYEMKIKVEQKTFEVVFDEAGKVVE